MLDDGGEFASGTFCDQKYFREIMDVVQPGAVGEVGKGFFQGSVHGKASLNLHQFLYHIAFSANQLRKVGNTYG